MEYATVEKTRRVRMIIATISHPSPMVSLNVMGPLVITGGALLSPRKRGLPTTIIRKIDLCEKPSRRGEISQGIELSTMSQNRNTRLFIVIFVFFTNNNEMGERELI